VMVGFEEGHDVVVFSVGEWNVRLIVWCFV